MRRTGDNRAGFALVAVVLVLAALLMLLTPFLVTARNTDRASSQLFDRAATDSALVSARVHARSQLEASHPALDETPYYDSLEELETTNEFQPDFLDARDATGMMWDIEAWDVSGLIDLNSAPPQMISNLMGTTTRLARAITKEDDSLPVASASGLDPKGIVVVEGEYIQYGGIEGGELIDLERGLGATYDTEGNPLPGPRPPSPHGVGAAVLDQRAYGPTLWRLQGESELLRSFTSTEQLGEADQHILAESGLGEAARKLLRERGTVYGGVRAGAAWQRPARLVRAIEGGIDDHLGLDSVRWFNEGSTVWITDGFAGETAVVRLISRGGTVYLDRPLQNSYDAYQAVVHVLARRPVNINTAPVEVLEALLLNLQRRGRNSRVTGSEARALVAVMVESRPFTGLEDFLRRVVLPAAGIEDLPEDAGYVPAALEAGAAIIDPWDAIAIYTNALNANDAGLAFSTMPFCFASRDTYASELRATINARSGVERYSEVREEVGLVAPQAELIHVWARQRDFDEELRNRREAPFWMTGPNSTTRHDATGSNPPTRLWAQLGTYEGQLYVPGAIGNPTTDTESEPTPEHVFASEEEDDYAQLWPSRIAEVGARQGRLIHFDHETRDPEGRYLPDQVVRRSVQQAEVDWAGQSGLLRQLGFGLWLKPLSLENSMLLDVGGTSLESDRLSLLIEDEDLVLRVLDGVGDHPGTAFLERAEVRYPLAMGDGPGLPLETWSHVQLDVSGTKPDQLSMLVNGLSHGVVTRGLTRLSGSISAFDDVLPVVSTDGFPPRGVVRIGDELIEYVLSGNQLDARFRATGPEAGFGGRNARVRFDETSDPPLPDNLAFIDLDHAADTPVQLYGYSAPVASDVPSGIAYLPSDLGPFRVAVVTGVEGGRNANGDPIIVQVDLAAGTTIDIQFGTGIEGHQSSVTGLELAPADNPDEAAGDSDLMEAFSASGGYAVLMQRGALGRARNTTTTGASFGGIEILRYSGWDGNVLQIAQRGHLLNMPNQGANGTGSHAFVVDWEIQVAPADGSDAFDPNDRLSFATYVFPISVPVPGATDLRGFLQGANNEPQFAQLLRETQAELTEWICYNWFDSNGGHLVRDDVNTLALVHGLLTSSGDVNFDETALPPGGGGGGGGGGGASGGGDTGGGQAVLGPLTAVPAKPAVSPVAPRAPAPSSPSRARAGAQWEPLLGEADDDDKPLTRAVRILLQHRGVHGTAPQRHAAGTAITPVFHVLGQDADFGLPGRYDSIFVVGQTYDHVGWPVEVHRAHLPSAGLNAVNWDQADPMERVATAGATAGRIDNVGADRGVVYVALREPQPEPMVAGSGAPLGGAGADVEARHYTRLTKFPSGERPRLVVDAVIGGSFLAGNASVPSAVVDEIQFGDSEFGTRAPNVLDPEATQGAQLVLDREVGPSDDELWVLPRTIRVPFLDFGTTHEFLSDLPSDAGLLRIGEEILAYDQRSPADGLITVAEGGRGLLGTDPAPHARGEAVNYLSDLVVSALSASIGEGDAELPLTDFAEFPSSGTVLIDRELIHYTRLRSGALEMPRRSSEPGVLDGEGEGLFRGRYGTEPEAHAAGAPVILFPFRYWDRWAERADVPELSYFGFELEQPAAWWRTLYFEDEQPVHGGVDLGILMRTDPDVPWDADPELEDELELFFEGTQDGAPLIIGTQSDLLQWRVFIDYVPGAFSYEDGMGHGWRTTPRLKQLAVEYLAPNILLRSVEK